MKKIALIAAILLTVLISFSLLSIFLQPGINDGTVIVEIPKGASAGSVALILKRSGVIKRVADFKLAGRMLTFSDLIKAGRYRFAPRPLLISVFNDLLSGKTVGDDPIRAVFPEGSSIYKMGTILEKEKAAGFDDFRSLSVNYPLTGFLDEFTFLRRVPIRSLEGYLFPDTYIFDRNISAEALARLMLRRFSDVVIPYWEQNQNATKYDLHQIITLASIIEKEAKVGAERPIISSVFHNRLDIKMALAADPTVKYSLERPSKRVFFDQLKVDSPYNTYKYHGLPPGPISNPGIDSVKAAIYPAKSDFLYFVARPDGSHIFTASWAEHQKARYEALRIRRTSR